MADGVEPASAAMTEEIADWYVGYTAGQLKKVCIGGTWYLSYAAHPPGPAALPARPRWPHEPDAIRDANNPWP